MTVAETVEPLVRAALGEDVAIRVRCWDGSVTGPANAALQLRIENRRAIWSGKIMIDGDQSEVMELLEERVNSLATPFELEWHHVSAKPWDWQLVHVSNSALEIPADFD